jgi:hypothetical protein
MLCGIWGSHSGRYEEFCILRYNAVQSAKINHDLMEHTASIFKVEEQANQETNMKQRCLLHALI